MSECIDLQMSHDLDNGNLCALWAKGHVSRDNFARCCKEEMDIDVLPEQAEYRYCRFVRDFADGCTVMQVLIKPARGATPITLYEVQP